MPHESATFACHLTAPGRSAIAVVGVHGNQSWQIVRRHFQAATARDWSIGQIRYGQWVSTGEPDSKLTLAPESIVVTPMSHQMIEVHCHGGAAAVRRILSDLAAAGVTTVDHHAFLAASQNDPLSADDPAVGRPLCLREADAAVAHALTPRMVAVALDQTRGALYRWARTRMERLQSTTEPTSTAEQTRGLAREVADRQRAGLHLATRRRVVLCGPPNVGKSSLINRIVGGHRNITHDQPGTTRDVVRAEATIQGVACELLDTAGLRFSDDAIESAGVQKASSVIADADVLVVVGDPNSPPSLHEVQNTAFAAHSEMPDRRTQTVQDRVILVMNKRDLLSIETPAKRATFPSDTVLLTQARANASGDANWDQHAPADDAADGIDALVDAIGQHLQQALPHRGAAVPVTVRQHQILLEIASTCDATHQLELLAQLIG
ncbi:MAG: GTPase [Planctomycetota bacterium]